MAPMPKVDPQAHSIFGGCRKNRDRVLRDRIDELSLDTCDQGVLLLID